MKMHAVKLTHHPCGGETELGPWQSIPSERMCSGLTPFPAPEDEGRAIPWCLCDRGRSVLWAH